MTVWIPKPHLTLSGLYTFLAVIKYLICLYTKGNSDIDYTQQVKIQGKKKGNFENILACYMLYMHEE